MRTRERETKMQQCMNKKKNNSIISYRNDAKRQLNILIFIDCLNRSLYIMKAGNFTENKKKFESLEKVVNWDGRLFVCLPLKTVLSNFGYKKEKELHKLP